MIELKSVLIGKGEKPQIRIFSSQDEAISHLCDHVLTRPEAHYWSLLIVDYLLIVDPTKDQELDQIADALWRGDEQNKTQTLYDGYAREIELSLRISVAQHWQWEENRVGKSKRYGIGPSGVMVVWHNQIVVSAMLQPFAARKPRQHISYHDRLENSRPRKGAWVCEYRRLDSFRPENNEKTRYELFRKAFSSVRRQFQAASKGGTTAGDPLSPKEMPIPNREEWRRISESALRQLEQSEQRS